jgi:hypothetical protein
VYKKVRKYESHMTNLAGFIAIGVKGLFHSYWMDAGPAASSIGWEREKWKFQQPFLHTIDESCWRIWQVFSTLTKHNCHMTTPLLPVAQLLHSSADTVQITSNCLFNCYVSHILVK